MSTPTGCDCIERANQGLAEMGAMVKTSWICSRIGSPDESYSTRVAIAAQKIDSRSKQRLPVLIAQFCPFCGIRYRADDGATLAAEREPAARGAV